MTDKSKDTEQKKTSPVKLILRVLLALLVFVLLLPLIIHFGPVQKFFVDRISEEITERTRSTVNIGEVDFSVLKGFELRDIYISRKNMPEDTLLFANSISSSLLENLTSLYRKRLSLEEINLAGLDLRVVTMAGDTVSSLDQFLAALTGEGNANNGNNEININLQAVNLDYVKVYIEDENNGSDAFVSLDKGLIELEDFSSLSDTLRLSTLMLSNPKVVIQKHPVENRRGTVVYDTADSDTLFKDAIKPWHVFIDHLELSGGVFSYDDWRRERDTLNPETIDFQHLAISNFNINADTTSLNFPLEIRSNIKSLTLKEKTGFEIQQLDVRSMTLDLNQLKLTDFVLKTNDSYLNDQLHLSYNDLQQFAHFTDSVRISSELTDSELALSDLKYFFPHLERSPFFKLNKDRKLFISGKVYGTIDDLHADNVDLAVDRLIRLKGSLSTRDLTHAETALINLYVDRLTTSLSGLRRVIPGFRPPSQFYKLDPIRFTGDIDGFFNDFVIYGYLQSDLGRVTLDTRLDLKKGRNNASYSGDIALEDFNLAEWTDNEDFGEATLTASIRNGKGLTLENVYADLDANLEKFEYKGYTYSDIILEGEFQKNQFDGIVEATDENIDLSFNGQIDLSGNRVLTNFKADIRNIDLVALNLSKDFSAINGKFKSTLRGSEVKNFEGFVDVEGLSLIYKDKHFVFDSLYVSSSPGAGSSRNVIFSSDIINASMDGIFNLKELLPALQGFVVLHHPSWAERLNIQKPLSNPTNPQDFRFKVKIKDTRDYLELMDINDLRIRNLTFEGRSNLAADIFESYLEVGSVSYKDYTFKSLHAGFLHHEHLSKYDIVLDRILSKDRLYDPVTIDLDMNGDVLDLKVRTTNILDSIGNVDVAVRVKPEGDRLHFHVDDNMLQMFSASWTIDEDNQVVLGDEYIDIRQLVLTDGVRSISFNDYKNRGIDVLLEEFDFELINGIIDYDKIDFTGRGNLELRLNTIFDKPVVYVNSFIPAFRLNGEDYGALTINGSLDTTQIARLDLKLERSVDELFMNLTADYNLETREIDGDVTARNMVMSIFEFIIDEGISNTSGTADLDVSVYGTVDDIKLKGDGKVSNGKTTIDYLGAQLDLGTEKIRISETFIDLTNVSLYDRFGNRAIMLGGLQHDLFADFESRLNMRADRFLALETTKEDNPLYYGTGIGEISVDFSGPFHSTDIDVTAITGPGTVLNIPVEDSYQNFDESFITFVDRESILNPTSDTVILAPKLEGVDVEMNLTITRDAQVSIIFNERLNDVIKGRGNGDLRIIVSREGDFNMFGNYEVESGDYLFTAWGIVAKPFTVRRGGLITWTGDPINANLNIVAEYSGLRVPVNVFLAEYLISAAPSVQSEAKKRTAVDLTMKLTGTLYNPVVNFDLAFPELQGELRTFADNKVRTLRENEADLNEQVAGLIMFRSFLPSNSLGDNLLTSESLTQTGYNTLSEFVSNQLSYLLSGFLQEALAENGFVSGIDFEIGFSRNADVNEEGNLEVDQLIPDEIEVHFKPRFQNDKWGFDYGTSFVNSSTFTNYIIHDFVLEYYLTEDRRLKLRAYGKWDKDEVEFGNEQKYGVGINYRKEFGSITEFQKALNKDIKDLKESSQTGTQ